jgi:hypothetical protein
MCVTASASPGGRSRLGQTATLPRNVAGRAGWWSAEGGEPEELRGDALRGRDKWWEEALDDAPQRQVGGVDADADLAGMARHDGSGAQQAFSQPPHRQPVFDDRVEAATQGVQQVEGEGREQERDLVLGEADGTLAGEGPLA